MNEIWQIITLGVVQGVTELLPISSDGHLILARAWFGLPDSGLAVDVLLHVGTLVAIVGYFFTEWRKIIFRSKTWGLIVVATIPAIICGVAAQNLLEVKLRSVMATAGFMLASGIFLLLSERYFKRQAEDSQPNANHWEQKVTPKKAFIIGWFQALALLPGVSRSGMTLLGGKYLGLSRVQAATFSFIIGAVAIAAAGIWGAKDLFYNPTGMPTSPGVYLIGLLTAAVVSWLVVAGFMKFIKRFPLTIFGWYLVLIGSFTLATELWK